MQRNTKSYESLHATGPIGASQSRPTQTDLPCRSTLPLSGCVSDNVIDADNHFRSLCRCTQLRHLASEALHNAKLGHVRDSGSVEVETMRGLSPSVCGSQCSQKVCTIVASVVGHDGWDCLQ